MKKRRVLWIVLAALAAVAALVYLLWGRTYLRRHFRTVTVDRQAAVTGERVDLGGRRAIAVYFTRVGNSDFESGVDAVSSASVVRSENGIAGNAQLMAQWVAEETGGTLFEIQTAEKYPVDYTETTNVAKAEQNENARPALAAEIEDFDSYSTVCLVFPNWWGDLPMALYSFFEAYDFTGKTLYVSVTHGGSGFSRTVSTIEELAPGALVAEGLSVRDSNVPGAEDSVRQWARETVVS